MSRTETSYEGGNFSIVEYDDDTHRRIVEMRPDGSVSIGDQYRYDDGHWYWYQDQGATLSAEHVALLVEAYVNSSNHKEPK